MDGSVGRHFFAGSFMAHKGCLARQTLILVNVVRAHKETVPFDG